LNFRFRYSVLFLVLLYQLFYSCGSTRRLDEGQHLVHKNKFSSKSITGVQKNDLENLAVQKPNKRILGFRFHLFVHNLANTKRGSEKRFNRQLMDVVGEAPVVMDSLKMLQTNDRISRFLAQKGYFNSTVSNRIRPVWYNKKKLKIYYEIEANRPYYINNFFTICQDKKLDVIIEERLSNRSLVKEGDILNLEILDRERDRLTDELRIRGYYDFNKEFISFEVDSTLGGNRADVIMQIRSPRPLPGDTLPEHKRYRVRNITVYTDYRINADTAAFNRMNYEDITFAFQDVVSVKPKIISQSIFIRENEMYNIRRVEDTYKRLTALKIFSSVNIQFVKEEGSNILDCIILLSPAKVQTFSVESRGTNRGGFLGTALNFTYRNRNTFRGAEMLEISMNGGLESQPTLTEDRIDEDSRLINDFYFNTIEFGPEVSLFFPKFFFPISPDRVSRTANPRTVFTASYNLQQRPDFIRNLSRISMRYQWNESITKQHFINPIEVSVISVEKSSLFRKRLEDFNDLFLLTSFQDHMIVSSRYTFLYNNQVLTKATDVFYYRGNIEFSGNILRAINNLLDSPQDDIGSYQILGIRYAQFIKTDHEFRYRKILNDKSSAVYRIAAGVAVPLSNLGVLPFEKGFFVGGANGLRAWRPRTIGPGAYFDNDPRLRFDKIGDIKFESNVEYRFKLIKMLEGAFFVDAGNVWLMREDDIREGGVFKAETFLSEIAIGGGVGARLDFNFFLIRFDFAMQLKDPSLTPGERWVYQPKDNYNSFIAEYNAANQTSYSNYRPRINLNLGIGYPF
jgi:hypothetical protein